MIESDINQFVDAFAKQQWDKPYELYRSYYNQQSNKERIIIVAEVQNKLAGYVTLLDQADTGPFAEKDIPEIVDFNVLINFQKRGIGSKLMDVIEALAKEKSNFVSLAVGINRSYGTAQRMYVKRGYIPDGTGAWYNGVSLEPYALCANDDDLLLYFLKNLTINVNV
ncbi:GNAT family N-acetyltransferase [Oceanobacillus neutriphilus]|nr:GNAT family N-acetyltransferase [Oceanobacillus neutriphilus]